MIESVGEKLYKHRIIPGHVGGTYESSNIVLLTLVQHADAHRVLYEQYGRWQDNIAWRLLSGAIGHEEAMQQIRIENGKATKGRKYGPITETARLKMRARKIGKRLSPEHRANISAAKRGRKLKPEHCQNIASGKRGKPRSPETIRKMSASAKGKPWTLARRQAVRTNPCIN